MTTWLPVLLPVVGAGGAVLSRRRTKPLVPVVVGSLVLTLVAAVAAAWVGGSATWSWGAGIFLELAVEGPARLMVVLVPLVAIPVVLYAATSFRHDPSLGRLLALMTGFVAAMELLVLASDFLTLLIGWELVGAFSWSLIGYEWRDPDRPGSAKEAFVTTRFGDLGLYVAAGAAFAATGTFRYADLAAGGSSAWLGVVAGGVVLAAAAKSAQVPFSPWLFSAMAGPTPVSALLHSATMVAAGAYALIRLEPILRSVEWFSPLVIGLGLVTSLLGGVVASVQTDFKKALAGSTSAQYGLMLVAAGAGYTAAGLGQLTAHAFFKALLFLGAGIALHATNTLDLGKLRLGSTLPGVAALFGVGAAALAAVPPLGGAFTKETVLAAAFEAGTWVGAGTLVAGLLSALYASRLHLLGYGPGGKVPPLEHPHRGEILALGILAALSLGLGGLWLPGGEEIAQRVVGVLPTGEPWELWASVGGLAAAFAVVWVLWRRDRLVDLGLPEGLRRFVAEWWGVPIMAKAVVVDPTIELSRGLEVTDRRGVDGVVEGVAASFRGASRWMRRVLEGTVDRLVMMAGGGTIEAADLSREVDDHAVDGVVEDVASAVGLVGAESRKIQTGMSHHYYTMLAIGAVVAVVVAAIWR